MNVAEKYREQWLSTTFIGWKHYRKIETIRSYANRFWSKNVSTVKQKLNESEAKVRQKLVKLEPKINYFVSVRHCINLKNI